MSFGDFGNFGNWTPKDHAINKMAYDKSHKNGGGPNSGNDGNNPGCGTMILVFVIAIVIIVLFGK